jgi:hypothetical protein
VRAGEANPLDAFTAWDFFKQLNEGAFLSTKRKFTDAVLVHNLSQKGNFTSALSGKLGDFINDSLHGAGALRATGFWNDAVGTFQYYNPA